MRDEDHRRLDLAVDAHELGAHLPAQCGVETGERLVQQEELRSAHERLGDGHPLPLPAGELVDPAVEQRPDVQHARRLRPYAAAISCFGTRRVFRAKPMLSRTLRWG